jgi:hypothetical protein
MSVEEAKVLHICCDTIAALFKTTSGPDERSENPFEPDTVCNSFEVGDWVVAIAEASYRNVHNRLFSRQIRNLSNPDP